ERRATLALAACALGVGMAPAVAIQISNYVRFGSPIHPYQFEMVGLKLGGGMPMRRLFEIGGLSEYSLGGFLKAPKAAYFLPARWPFCFFDGRNFGDSIFVITAILGLPLTLPRMSRLVRALLVAFLLLSLAAKDFWQPRYAYGIITGICICNGLL